MEWKISPAPFPLGENLAKEIESLGRVLLQFYRAVNLLYRKSAEGKQPEWVARWLDLGKPRELIELQRSAAFKNDVPRVIRPDILLTDDGLSITELDSVPGGIGLTAWLGKTYSKVGQTSSLPGAEGAIPENEMGRLEACPTLKSGAFFSRAIFSMTSRASKLSVAVTTGIPGLMMPAFSRAIFSSVSPRSCMWS